MKKNERRITHLVIQYLLIFVTFSILFFLFLHSPLFKGQTILFFRGVILLIVATTVTFICVIVIRTRLKMSYETILAAIILSISIHLTLFLMFPVTFDRSITMYLLNTLYNVQKGNECNGYLQDNLEQKLISEYIRKDRALDKRLKEQQNLNFIQQNGQCIELTDKGQSFVNTSFILKKIYGIQ